MLFEGKCAKTVPEMYQLKLFLLSYEAAELTTASSYCLLIHWHSKIRPVVSMQVFIMNLLISSCFSQHLPEEALEHSG